MTERARNPMWTIVTTVLTVLVIAVLLRESYLLLGS